MQQRHSHSIGNLDSLQSQQDGRYTLSIVFHVPYHAQYGFFNLSYVRKFPSKNLDAALLQPILQCYELRGHGVAVGIHASVEHLQQLAELLRLCCKGTIPLGPDASLRSFTYEHWYLFAPNESSQLFPVNRETNHICCSRGERSPRGGKREAAPQSLSSGTVACASNGTF